MTTHSRIAFVLTLVTVIFIQIPGQAQPPAPPDRRIALTFDDLPMTAGDDCDASTVRIVTKRLTQALAARDLPAAGFATPGRECLSSKLLAETLGAWHEVGAIVGNHTATHPDLNSTSIEHYAADIERAQRLIDVSVGTGDRWFRPPYLRSGDEAGKKRALKQYLRENGYRLAPVTVDNQEWIYAAVYADARDRGDAALASRIVDAYVAHLEECIVYYERLSLELFGREIPQVLLLHANFLNSEQLDRVIAMLEGRGYRFIGLPEAVSDPAFAREDTYLGPRGLSWLQRWALEDGVDVPSEPRETEWVADAFRAIGARDGEIIDGADVEGNGGAPAPALAPSVKHPPVELPGTERRFLQATSNDVEYELYVSLPNDYDDTMRRYPVIYLLDADYSFAIARNVVEHLSDRDHLTPAVIVAIAYDGPPAYRMNRTRDYTPKHSPNGGYGPEYQAISGGGPQFLAFIEHQLVPFIEREYRVTEKRVLVGHSYGGLFASWTLLTRPQLFDSYVIVSPSLWYDNHWIFDLERRRRDTLRDASARVFLSVGSREVNNRYDMPADLDRFAAVLEAIEIPNLHLRWSIKENETHNSIFPGALSDGLRFVLEGR